MHNLYRRRIFKHLDINDDGQVAPDDLKDIKGRLYEVHAKSNDSLQKLSSAFLPNEDAIDALRQRAQMYLTHREG